LSPVTDALTLFCVLVMLGFVVCPRKYVFSFCRNLIIVVVVISYYPGSDLIDARMDATRNKFLLASLCMSIASLSLTAMTCVGGVFGMNLRTGFEETPTMFLKVTYGSVFGSLLLGIAIFVGMIRTGVITGMGPVDKEGIDSLF